MSNLLPKKTPTSSKVFFKTYEILLTRKTSRKVHIVFYSLALILKQLQYFSCIIITGSNTSNYSKSKILYAIRMISRIDYILISADLQNFFHVTLMIIILTNLAAKIIIAFQVYTKKKLLLASIANYVKATNWLINSVLLVPLIFYVSNYLITIIKSNVYVRNAYGDNLLTNGSTFLGLMALVVTMCLLRFLDITLGNIPKYSSMSSSKMHSICCLKDLYSTIILAASSAGLNAEYNLYIFLIAGISNSYSYLYYLPYPTVFFNRILIQTWTAVAVLSVLLIISIKLDNFLIAELNFPFLYLALFALSSDAIQRRLNSLKSSGESSDPYTHELKIRSFLLYQKDPPEKEEFVYKHFYYANSQFFGFVMQYVWESMIFKRVLRNFDVSLLKLVKINAVLHNKNEKDLMNDFYYTHLIEAKFLLFVLYRRNFKHLTELDYGNELIKYNSHFETLKTLDREIVYKLLDLLQNISGDSKADKIEKKIEEIGRLALIYKKDSVKMLEKFASDKKIAKLFGSFLSEIFNKEEGILLLKEHHLSGLSDIPLFKLSSDVDRSYPTLLISGWCQNIGTIIYANFSMFQLLRIEIEHQLLGVSFCNFIPEPFGSMHEKVLFRYLFYRNFCTLTRSHLFLLDDEKYCIEVSMHFRLCYYNGFPYFVAGFKPIDSTQRSMILTERGGRVISFSRSAKHIFTDLSMGQSLFIMLPALEQQFQNIQVGKVFEYKDERKKLYMKINVISIDGFELLILYFVNYFLPDPDLAASGKNKAKKVEILETIAESKIDKIQLKNGERRKSAVIIDDNDKVFNKKLKSVIKILNFSTRFLLVLEVLVTICVLILIINIINTISVNYIIFDIGLMRYLSCSALSNLFSLELLHQNYTLAFPESTYKSTLQSNSIQLQSLINTYRQITLPFLNEKRSYFSQTQLPIYRYKNTSFTQYTDNLFNALEAVAKYSLLISNSSFASFSSLKEERMFLLRNIPATYINTLNQTVMDVMSDLINSLDKIFIYLQYVELICLLPPFILLFIYCASLFFLEKINKRFWNSLKNRGLTGILETKTKLANRLFYYHDEEYVDELEVKKINKGLKNFISLGPILKVFCFCIISLAFYFSISYGPQRLLLELMKRELVHTNFGGMRRFMTPLTLFWGRSALLSAAKSESYEFLIKSFGVPSSYEELVFRTNLLVDIQAELMSSLENSIEKYFLFEQYKDLMFGDACRIVTNIPNCSQTIANFGLDAALQIYAQELISQEKIVKDSGYRPMFLVPIEKYSKIVEKAFVFGLWVYANYTNQVVEELKGYMSVTASLYLLVVVVYYFVFLHSLADGLFKNIENKKEILEILSPSKTRKAKSNPNTNFESKVVEN